MVICDVGWRQYSIPNLEWHTGISGEEACNIVVAPRADDAFGYIGAFVIGRNIFDRDFGGITEEGFEAF